MKILVIKHRDEEVHKTFFTEENVKLLEELGEISYVTHTSEDFNERLEKEIADADICMTCWEITPFSKELLDKALKLKMIAHVGGTATPVYSEELKNRGIIILTGNKYFAESVAEGAIAYMLVGQRKMYKSLKDMEYSGWKVTFRYTNGLRFKTVGLLGFGMIAKNVARMLSVFECEIKVCAEYPIPEEEAEKYNIKVCSREELFETSDIISVHMGLNESTYHFVDKQLLSLMREDSLIINTARGAVISEEDLTEVLKEGKIRAVLDVYEQEPLPMESELRNLPNVTLFPHNGGPTTDIRAYIVRGFAEDIKRFINGEADLEYRIDYGYIKNMTHERYKR